MHPIIYPNNVNSDSKGLRDYILNICNTHKVEKRALAFAFIIADLHNPHINKILRDDDYINSLHIISGKTLTVFFMMDNYVKSTITETTKSDKMLFEFGVEPINAPPSIMPKDLAKILIDDELLVTPAILFFQVDDFIVKDFYITQLTENKIEDGFLEIKNLIQKAVNCLNEVKEENCENSTEIFNLIKIEMESSAFWKKTKQTYAKFISIKEFLSPWLGI